MNKVKSTTVVLGNYSLSACMSPADPKICDNRGDKKSSLVKS